MGHFPFYLIVFLKVMTLSLGSTILLPLFLRIFTYQTARKSCIFRLLSEGRKGFWSEWLIASNWAFIMSRSFEKSFLWISTLPSHENGWDKCPFFTRNDLTVVISFSPQKAVENCNSVFFHRPQSRWFMCIVEFGQKLALWIPTLDDNSTEPSMAAASSHFGDLCADSRALFRAGRQLLQVGSHDI